MKIMTILGTRPEIIRLSRIIEKLDRLCQQVLVHTGQNYDANLNDIFFDQLGVRAPDHYLGARGSFGEQIGRILAECERIMLSERPAKFLVLGDTNSSLAAIIAKRLGIPVYHMEAGNRCYDDRVPEEVNRRLIDHSSDILMPYTERSRQNLLREGIPGQRIYVTGNPIYEVIRHYEPQIQRSTILSDLGLETGRYFLVTVHRAENVDIKERLAGLLKSFDAIQKEYNLPIVCSTHPRTRDRMQRLGTKIQNNGVRFLEPFGFFDFVKLQQNAYCVLTDSGTVQEESCIMRIPNVIIRDTTERPETIECGSGMLSGADPRTVAECVRVVMTQTRMWNVPQEYVVDHVSDIVVKIVLGFQPRPSLVAE